MPGNPASQYIEQGLSGAARKEELARLGLDQPLHVQYVDYISGLLTGDFGMSYMTRKSVTEIVWVKFWNTILLMGISLVLAFTIAILLGALLAWYRGSDFEKAGIIVTLLGRSAPPFVTGIVLIVIFALHWDFLPAGGMRPTTATVDGFFDRYFSKDVFVHAILPIIATMFTYFSLPTLVMRNTMLEILNDEFIEIKKAEGLNPFVVLYKHAVRNSLLPIVTVGAILVGRAVGGQILIEVVFSWPGMGLAMVEAVRAYDYPLAQATFFLMGAVIIIMNFVADILYGYLDPRVTYD
jgi:peptide/nickel transport system permease protein